MTENDSQPLDLALTRRARRRGIMLVILAAASFSISAAFAKTIGTGIPVAEVIFFRNFFALFPLLPVVISAGGVGDSFEQMPGFFQVMIKMTALKTAYAQLHDMEQQLLASGLDVCIARPTGLTDGPLTGKVVVAKGFKGRATISRADVAQWMLDQLEVPTFAEKTPMITVTGAA
jgi:hypothetical protein